MHNTLKPLLHCDEEPFNIKFCANLCHCSLWRKHFFDACWMQSCLA